MNVVEQLAEPHRTVLTQVLQEKDPSLLDTLRGKNEPSRADWRAVTNTLDDAASEHWIPGSDYEMDERGLAIDLAMGAFINAFIHVNDRGPDGSEDRPGHPRS